MSMSTLPTSDKAHERIMPDTPLSVSAPKAGNAFLFYKGQVFDSGGESSEDGVYQSVYLDKEWTGGLDAPPIFRTQRANPSAVAAISWSGGKEKRVYYIGEGNLLQEYCYSAGKPEQWRHGLLNDLEIQTSASSIAAVHWSGDRGSCIRVYYQGLFDGFQSPIKEVIWNNDSHWSEGPTLMYAYPGCGLAAVVYQYRGPQIRLYYQSYEQTLGELCWSEEHDKWLPGELNLGEAGDATPITAFGWSDGVTQEVRVYWRNKLNQDNMAEIVGARKVDFESWKPIGPVVGGILFDHKFAVTQWDNSKHIRLYYQTARGAVFELCNDNGAGWFPGAKFGGDR